ncbi:sigma factor-like helix-turn-helix DNA-binding protein [Sphaerimonospora mesophila]|uniref:sigma factor-like helix-turn-helix DNA-binding protein n=1 Tax=Sphaerimonospora mesophila TaxID=37483 RepID=UPI0006E2476F
MAFRGMVEALNAASPETRFALATTYASQLATHAGGESLAQLLRIGQAEAVDVSGRCATVRARNILISNGLRDLHELLQVTVPDLRDLRNCGQLSLADILVALLISAVEGDASDEAEDGVDLDATLLDLFEDWAYTLSDRQRLIFRHRIVRRDRNLEDLGHELSVTRERVRQLEKKLIENFNSWRTSAPAADRIADLDALIRSGGSPLTTLDAVSEQFSELSEKVPSLQIKFRTVLGVLLPDLDIDEPWLATTSLSDLRDRSFRAALGASGESLDRIRDGFGMAESEWADWLGYCGLRALNDVIVPKGASQPELAVAVLGAAGRPLSAEEIAEQIQVDAIRSLRNRLQDDDRIVRVGPNSYGLPEWNLETYEGIREEIVQRIERGGGRAWLSDVVEELVEQFAVSPASVRAYASRREFARRDGWITLANGDANTGHTSRKLPTPRETRRCFFLKEQWWLRVDITRDTLRGSGFPVPLGVMSLFQVAEGTERTFGAAGQDIRISWTGLQPHFGSVRHLVTQLAAKPGDVLWLSPMGEGSIRARLVRAWSRSDGDEIALRAGLRRGIHGNDLRVALASALELPAETSWNSLVVAFRSRGDLDLAETVEGYVLSDAARAVATVPDLGDFLAALGGS